MSTRPQLKLILGLNDLQVRNGEIVDPRFICCSMDPDEKYIWNSTDTVFVPRPCVRLAISMSTDQEIEQDIRNNKTRLILTDRLWYNTFHWDCEYGDPSVCGYIVKKLGYDDDFFYALMTLHPEYESGSGYRVLPSEGLDKFDASLGGDALRTIQSLTNHNEATPIRTMLTWYRSAKTNEERRYRKEMLINAARKNRLIRRGLNIRWWTHRIETDLAVARWVFRQAGFRIDTDDLKLMLYWQWS